MLRIVACAVAVGCTNPGAAIRNHVQRWSDSELCTAIPAQVGRDGPALDDVRYVGKRVESSTMNGTTHDVWRVSTPRPFREVGVESFAGVPIAAWIETTMTVAELCDALGLPIVEGNCSRSARWGIVIAGVVAHPGRARLTCIQRRHLVGAAMR